MGVQEKDPLAQLSLPPGFRFYPTDEELMVQYLCRKIAGHHFSLPIIAEIDLYKFDPWVLPSKALFGEKEWYFFSPRDRKYPNGSRPNRVAGSGYWKATGTDKIITTQGRRVGIKKALVFYVGKAPKGTKTNWIMHEYRLIEPTRKTGSSKLDDWVLCRIYKKSSGTEKPTSDKEHSVDGSSSSSSSHLDNAFDLLPHIGDRSFALPRMNPIQNNVNQQQQQPQQQNQGDKIKLEQIGSGDFNWALLARLSSTPDFGFDGSTQNQTDQVNRNNNNDASDVYASTVPPLLQVDNKVDEEVQSGNRTLHHNTITNHDSRNYNRNSNVFTQSYSDSMDPFRIRYPTQQAGFEYGYRQNE